MSTAPSIKLERVAATEAPRLEQMMELYLHDLSEIFPIELGPDGRFRYPWLSEYFAGSERRLPFFIHSQHKTAGFILVTVEPAAGAGLVDLDVTEFFILRSFRRLGVGRAAAFALFDQLPGRWTVRVAEANRRGIAFWPGAIAAYCGDSRSESIRPGSVSPVRVFNFASPV
jgi:predicted acetyltransferase